MQPIAEKSSPLEQGGFRQNRNCCDQVLAITTHVKNSFQQIAKSGALFLDLSSAYDTVWTRGLLLKIAKTIRCKATILLPEKIISNRKFRVTHGGKTSRYKILQKGLPQGAVLSPMLFNIYTADMTDTVSRKFIYADDVALVTQATSFEKIESVLNADVAKVKKYFQKWHLKLNPNKSVTCAFYLNNREASRTLNIVIEDQKITTEEAPKYLGVRMDRTLTFRQHLESVKVKIKTRNNIVSKLAGTSWGCHANVLHTSALALVYSVADYCAPVWARSAHCKKVDVQLNNTMRIITGPVRSTQLDWLPVLSNIAPPDLRRQVQTESMILKLSNYPDLPVQIDIANHLPKRLRSRKPIWSMARSNKSIEEMWANKWTNTNVRNHFLVNVPDSRVPGFELSRAQWTALNRIRTGQGRCNYQLHKWGMTDSPLCECGLIQTTSHIVEECQRRRFEGGIATLHICGPMAIKWLEELDIRL